MEKICANCRHCGENSCVENQVDNMSCFLPINILPQYKKGKKLQCGKGNSFSLAELRLIKEKQEGVIPCYTTDDIIAYAKDIRDWLEKNGRELPVLTKEEKKKIKRLTDRNYDLFIRKQRGARHIKNKRQI
jgi:hypothetical protein